MGSAQYRHPGQLFIQRYGPIQCDRDVLRYAEFLRQAADLDDRPPIDLSAIYDHFGMPTPLRVPLVDQQGILLDSNAGVILIKEDDPLARQRFTEGHELMELLFDAQEHRSKEGASDLPVWQESDKERLCDRGAAELLMPTTSFLPQLQELGMSLESGRAIAALYQTSLIATLLRMIEHSSGTYALIMWHHAHSRRDQKDSSPPDAPTKLRIWWRTRTQHWSEGFIPKNKSISDHSLIALAYSTNQPQSGTETLNLGWGPIQCQVEAMPIQCGAKTCVLSLLQWLR